MTVALADMCILDCEIHMTVDDMWVTVVDICILDCLKFT